MIPIAGNKVLARCCLLLLLAAQGSVCGAQQVWRFNRTDKIGHLHTTTLGHPHVIDSPLGKAVQFDGKADALYVEEHPLAGASTWTWEVIFEPDADGSPQQRFFHLSVLDAAGHDTDDRLLFEIRIVDHAWCLDTFALSGKNKVTLLNCQQRYPLGKWYRVTAVYDGSTLSNYVGDELQGQGKVDLAPQGQGRASIGTRINRQDFFKGAVYEARFTRRAFAVPQFLKLPRAR